MRVRWAVTDNRDEWTPRAVAGLVGQRPRLTRALDLSGPSVRTKVEAAWIEDGQVVVDLAVPDDAGDVAGFAEAFVPPDGSASYGYSLGEAVPDGTRRRLLDVNLLQVSGRD